MVETRKEIIYTRFGRKFRKIARHEVIKEGAMHAWCGGELQPITDPNTIGAMPKEFSDEREFYNLVKHEDFLRGQIHDSSKQIHNLSEQVRKLWKR